jgi:hypothetical protein
MRMRSVWRFAGAIRGITIIPTKRRDYYDDDDDDKSVWPAWAVGVLSGVRDVETYNCGRPSQRSLRGWLNSPSAEAPVYMFGAHLQILSCPSDLLLGLVHLRLHCRGLRLDVLARRRRSRRLLARQARVGGLAGPGGGRGCHRRCTHRRELIRHHARLPRGSGGPGEGYKGVQI